MVDDNLSEDPKSGRDRNSINEINKIPDNILMSPANITTE
jgi:hypothetical protein